MDGPKKQLEDSTRTHFHALLFEGNTHSTAMATGSLGVLTTDSQAPRVTETTMDADFLHALKVLTELVIQVIGEELAVGAVLDVLLTIEEVVGDLVLAGVLHNGDDTLKISLVELTGTSMEGVFSMTENTSPTRVPLGDVDLGLAADEGGETATTPTNGSQGKDDLLATINVSVEDTQDVLESRLLRDVQRLDTKKQGVSKLVKKTGWPDGWISSWWK